MEGLISWIYSWSKKYGEVGVKTWESQRRVHGGQDLAYIVKKIM